MTITENTTGLSKSYDAGSVLKKFGKFDLPIVFIVVGLIGMILPSNLQFLGATILIYGLFATATNVLVGWAGAVTFGAVAFFAIGAYFVALMKESEWFPPLLPLAGGVIGGIVSYLFALLVLRLQGISFTKMTLVFGQVIWLLIFTIPALAGDNGIPGVPAGQIFGIRLARAENFWWYALIMVFLGMLVLQIIYRSSYGRNLLATRDDPVRAVALGVPVAKMRVYAIVISGFFGAVAGGLFAQQQGIVSAENANWMISGTVLIMCLIGGTGSFWGPMIGALVYQYLHTQIFHGIGYASLFVGIILLVVVLVLRGGISSIPERVTTLIKKFNSKKASK